jgi:ABC-2 type transport system permease protein
MMSATFMAQLKYQVTLITRSPRAFIFGLLVPALFLALQGHKHPNTSVLQQSVAGFIVFGMLNLVYLTYAAGLVLAREEGVLRRWYASPLPRWQYFAGRMVAYVVMADVAALIMLLVAASMSGLHLTLAVTGAVLLTVTIAGIAMAAAGTVVTVLLPPGQGAYSMLALTYLPLLVFSGGFGQINGLPHWLTQLMSYLPIQPAVSGVMSGLRHPGVTPGRDVLVLAIWAVAAMALSVRIFRWDPTRPAHAKRAPTPSTTVSYAGKLCVHLPAARLQSLQEGGCVVRPDG